MPDGGHAPRPCIPIVPMTDGPRAQEDDRRLSLEERLARLGPNQRALLEAQRRGEPITGHCLVARTLRDLGVTHVYGVAGQPVYDTFGACAKAGLRLIGTRHQQPAAMMAAAHNYFAGRQQAATIVSAGVSAANALGAVVAARDNCWPLVVLAGSAPTGTAGYFMALDTVELFRPVAKWATEVTETRAIPESIVRAFEVAMHERPGPVLVQLPENVLTGLARSGDDASLPAAHRVLEPDPAAVAQAVAMLHRASRPLLIMGKGLRWSAPFAALRELVDALALPFITSPIGCGTIPDDHPLCMNAIPWVAQSGADLVLVLGARLDWTFRYGRHIPPGTAIIRVDVHAAEFDAAPGTALGVHADAGAFLRHLLALSAGGSRYEAPFCRDRAWLADLKEARQRVGVRREAESAGDAARISPWRLARELRDALPKDAITVFDGNLVMAVCQRMIPAHFPACRLTPGTSGGLGGGIPYAMAAKIEHPERPVVAICGDYAFGLGAMELETAVRHNVPIVVVIANNDGNSGSRRQRMHLGDGSAEAVMMFRPGLRYERIMALFGGCAEHVDRPEDIGPALTRALADGRPACVNVAVDPDAPYPTN